MVNIIEVNYEKKEELMEINRQDGYRKVGADWFNKLIENKEKIFAAKEREELVGFAAVNPQFKYENHGVELDIISIKKEFQRKGIGARLINAVAEYAKENGKSMIYLFTEDSNEQAVNFYKKNGFEECGILKDRFGEGMHSLIFRKRL